MKKLLISAVLALTLVAVMAAPAMADVSEEVNASVTVTTYSSVTITSQPITFGSLDPGTVQSPATNNPAVTITAGSENNQDITVELSGTDFSDGDTNSFAIANAFWWDSDTVGSADAMAETGIGTDVVAALSAGDSVSVYHWLSVPTEQFPTIYNSTFTYTTNATDEVP
jgi:hypothetical protein